MAAHDGDPSVFPSHGQTGPSLEPECRPHIRFAVDQFTFASTVALRPRRHDRRALSVSFRERRISSPKDTVTLAQARLLLIYRNVMAAVATRARTRWRRRPARPAAGGAAAPAGQAAAGQRGPAPGGRRERPPRAKAGPAPARKPQDRLAARPRDGLRRSGYLDAEHAAERAQRPRY